jgi:RNA polymerase sigma factor (sigma-70 family)
MPQPAEEPSPREPTGARGKTGGAGSSSGDRSDTLRLVQRAREGDREAWDSLVRKYYPQWHRMVHGKIGADLHREHDTEDIIHSALGDAQQVISDLKEAPAFFSWMSMIIRHKLSRKRTALNSKKHRPLETVSEPGEEDSRIERSPVTQEEYERILDAMHELWEYYPDSMCAVYLKYFEKQEMAALMQTFERSERSVHRLVRTGLEVLRCRLTEL